MNRHARTLDGPVNGLGLMAEPMLHGEPLLFDLARYEATLAPWAEHPSRSRGRAVPESEDGRTPHQRVYREILERVFGPEAQARIAEGPAFQVMLAHPAEGRLADLHALLAGSAYQLEKAIVSRPSSEWAPNLGLEGRLVDARAAAAQGRMVELLLRAATIPPIFRIEDWDGRPAVDGGMIDHVPQPEPDRGRTLVLVTRDYRRMPEAGERITYVTPSEWVLSGKIDFTDPDKLRRAWTLGQEDGRAFLAHTDIHGLQ